jgi:hypothetical protein
MTTPKAKSKSEERRKEIQKERTPEPCEINANFLIKQIAWKNGSPYWTISLQLNQQISEAFFAYAITLEFDDSQLKREIEQLESEKEEILADSTLFGAEQEKMADRKGAAAQELAGQIILKVEELGTIEFGAMVSKIDQSRNTPVLELFVSDETVAKLNAKKAVLNLFKARLIPQLDIKL